MKVGDLVTFPNSVAAPQTGIVLSATSSHAKVYWLEDAEVSWEPIKWMEIISA